MVTKYLIYFAISILGTFPILFQDIESKNLSKIEQLQKGVLVLRLDMKQNSIIAYQEMLEQTDMEDKNYKVLEERIEELKLERLTYKENVIEAMKQSYNFSSYCFLESQDAQDFLGGDHSVLSWPEDGAKKNIKDSDYFFLIKGDEDTHWIVTDSMFNTLAYPFPNSHNIGFMKFIDFIIGGNNYSLKNQSKVFNKMNDRFHKFYRKRVSRK